MTPIIVAELSASHLGSLARMLELVREAATAGADAVKFQYWTPGSMVLDREFTVPAGQWAGQNLASLYEQGQVERDWLLEIFETAAQRRVKAFASVFDHQALAVLEATGCPMYKIASFELGDLGLIQAVVRTGKPVILSTGMATLSEIHAAVRTAEDAGCADLTVLKCTSAYPANASDAHLANMGDVRERYSCKVGVSDHSHGALVPMVAAAMGADMIEKHFTLARADGGPDAAFSMEPVEFKDMVRSVKAVAKVIGLEPVWGPLESELPHRSLRRSLHAARDIPAGKLLETEDLVTARPAAGAEPAYLPRMLGRVVARDVKQGNPVRLTDLE